MKTRIFNFALWNYLETKGKHLAWPAHAMMYPMTQPMPQAEFAQRVNRLRWILLLIWGSTTFGVAFFARDLSFNVLEKPFGFWMAAQGSLLMFLAITWVYALLVNRWEQQTQTDTETSAES